MAFQKIGRYKVKADKIHKELNSQLDITFVKSLIKVIQYVSQSKWARDPFDRLIFTYAEVNQSLLTRNKAVRHYCSLAFWN